MELNPKVDVERQLYRSAKLCMTKITLFIFLKKKFLNR